MDASSHISRSIGHYHTLAEVGRGSFAIVYQAEHNTIKSRIVAIKTLHPQNILFNAQGEALLADFGIAKIISTIGMKEGEVAGTPAYIVKGDTHRKLGHQQETLEAYTPGERRNQEGYIAAF